MFGASEIKMNTRLERVRGSRCERCGRTCELSSEAEKSKPSLRTALQPRFNSNVPGAYLQLFSYLKYISIDEEIGLYSVYQVPYYFVHL